MRAYFGFAAVVFFLGLAIGGGCSEKVMRQEAIDAGVAYYLCSKDGIPIFMWGRPG